MLKYGGRLAGDRLRKALSASDYYSAAIRASPVTVVPDHFFRSRGQNHNRSPYQQVLLDQPAVEAVFLLMECIAQLVGTLRVAAGRCHHLGLLGLVGIREHLDFTEAGDALNYLGFIVQEF